MLNRGVFSYGIDQAVLRAEQLILKHKTSLVILAFISHDINRSETAFFWRWKPYFEIDDESRLQMRNVPVPRDIPQLTPIRRILGRSYASHAVLIRLAPRMADMDREASAKEADMFQPGNHLSPRMNAWVAEHIENHLRVELPYADR